MKWIWGTTTGCGFGVFNHPAGLLPAPSGVQVLRGWQLCVKVDGSAAGTPGDISRSRYSYWSRQSWSLCWTSSACRWTGAFVMVSVRWVQDGVLFRPRTLVCLGTGAMMDFLKHVKTTSRSCLDTSTVHKDDLFRYFDARSNYDLIIMRKRSFLQKTVHCFQVLEVSMATSAG